MRNYNEDRVSIVVNVKPPRNYNKKWPKVNFFGLYDGHGGSDCANYLKKNLHKFIIEHPSFPENVILSI